MKTVTIQSRDARSPQVARENAEDAVRGVTVPSVTEQLPKIIFATGNEDKLAEIREIMAGFAASVLSMREAGVFVEPEENGSTFEDNAKIKAEACALRVRDSGRFTGGAIVLADDSGLEIDALGGAPGIYSARYLGHETPYPEKNRILLERLREVPDRDRTARFVCAVAAVVVPGNAADADQRGAAQKIPGMDPSLDAVAAQTLVVRATMEGRIAHVPAGDHGFGYDPIFFLPEYGRTSAELSPEEKNAVSHRGKALRAMRDLLEEKLR